MHRINARKARARFSELLDEASRGETVMITRRGRDIARLVPAEQPGGRKLPDLAAFRDGIAVRGTPLSREIIDARREERH